MEERSRERHLSRLSADHSGQRQGPAHVWPQRIYHWENPRQGHED